jgi:hypothetical protein
MTKQIGNQQFSSVAEYLASLNSPDDICVVENIDADIVWEHTRCGIGDVYTGKTKIRDDFVECTMFNQDGHVTVQVMRDLDKPHIKDINQKYTIVDDEVLFHIRHAGFPSTATPETLGWILGEGAIKEIIQSYGIYWLEQHNWGFIECVMFNSDGTQKAPMTATWDIISSARG